MIVRNGRNEVHDLGPRSNGTGITAMKVIGGPGSDGSGGWTAATMGFAKSLFPPREKVPYHHRYPEVRMSAPCLECGEQALTKNPNAIYCKTRCRNKAAQRRQRERQKGQAA
jgi:hypothetical protein